MNVVLFDWCDSSSHWPAFALSCLVPVGSKLARIMIKTNYKSLFLTNSPYWVLDFEPLYCSRGGRDVTNRNGIRCLIFATMGILDFVLPVFPRLLLTNLP